VGEPAPRGTEQPAARNPAEALRQLSRAEQRATEAARTAAIDAESGTVAQALAACAASRAQHLRLIDEALSVRASTVNGSDELLAAAQRMLAAEHAAVWGYTVAGAVASTSADAVAVLDALAAHRRRVTAAEAVFVTVPRSQSFPMPGTSCRSR
jgi:hypothetical protein